MPPEVMAEWERHPTAGAEWRRMVDLLTQQQSIPAGALCAMMRGLLDVLHQEGGGLNHAANSNALATLTRATMELPPPPRATLTWAVRTLTEPDGYLQAIAQEAIIWGFAGDAGAVAVAAFADLFRNPGAPAPNPRPRRPPPQSG